VIACVAGGTSGIGAEVARLLLERGDEVVVIGRGEDHAAEFRSSAGDDVALEVMVGDLTDPEFAAEVAAHLEAKDKGLGLLVNGAGSISGGGIRDESFRDWRRVMEANLDTAFNLTRACLGALEKAGDSVIVNISSVCSLRPCSSLSYSVSKAGMDMFTRCLARDLAPAKIRVNAVNPGVVRTNLQKSAGLFDDDESYGAWVEEMKSAHPLGRIGEPRDIAEAVLYLADGERAGWVTGAILSVDGGRAVA